jgi:hypothetical protein
MVWGHGRDRQERRFRDYVRETFPAEKLRFTRLREEVIAAHDRYRAELAELSRYIQRHAHLVVWDFRALEVEN